MPEECRVAEGAGQPGAGDQRLGHRRRDRRVGAREVVPLPRHRDTGQLPVPRGRVLAERHFGGRRPDPGGRCGEARQVDCRGGPDRLPEPEGGEVRDVERPGPAGLGPARGAGLHDMSERVGPFVAEGGRVGRAAAADAVHDEQRRPRHQAIRSRISGRLRRGGVADRVGGAHARLGAPQRRLVGGVDAGERRVGIDRGAEPDQVLEAHRVVDGVAGPAPPAPELDHGEPERPRVDRRDEARASRRHVHDLRRTGQMRLERVEEVRRPAERRHHALEALGGRARGEGLAQAVGARRRRRREPGGVEELGPERHRHVEEAAVDDVAAQETRGRRHLERVAGGGGERLVHVGDQRPGRAAGPGRHLDQRAGELVRMRMRRHEGARPRLDVEHQRIEPGGELLRQDRGGDQVDRFHRAGDVADAVEPAVGRGDVGGLPDDRAADLGDDAAKRLGVRLRRVAGDRVELVERSAGMAEAAPRDHRHIGAAGRERRREHQADVVADAAGRVLVDDRPRQVPVEDRAAVAHGERQRHPLVDLEPAQEHRHREGPDLALRDRLGGHALDDEAHLLGRQPPAVALPGDHLLGKHQ